MTVLLRLQTGILCAALAITSVLALHGETIAQKPVVKQEIKTDYIDYDIQSGEDSPEYTMNSYEDTLTIERSLAASNVATSSVSGASELTHNSKFASYTKTYGIDVSQWNGEINWNKVYASGVRFVIIRAGYRGTSTGSLGKDSKVDENIAGAKAAGLKVGVYFFSAAITTAEAKEEAQYTLNIIKNYSLDLPVYFDQECSDDRVDLSKINQSAMTSIALAFCDTISNAGLDAGFYSYYSWLTNYVNADTISAKYPVWLANISTETTYSGDYIMWQYSWTGDVDGMTGAVDMDVLYQKSTLTPNTVTDLSSVCDGFTATLSWSGDSKSLGYKVYRQSSSGTVVQLGTTSSTSYKVTLPTDTTQYSYYIIGYNTDNGTEVLGSKSNVVKLTHNKVANVKLYSYSNDFIAVNWDAFKTAAGYNVYIGADTSNLKKVASTTSTLYYIKGLNEGTKYCIRIYPYDSNGTQGYASATLYCGTRTTAPTNIATTGGSNAITIKWSKPSGEVAGYFIYSYDYSSKKYKQVASTTSTSYKLKNLNNNQTYLYSVRAYYYNNSNPVYGSYSDYYIGSTYEITGVSATYSISHIKLSWDKLSSATGYKVYYYDSASDSYKLYTVTTSNTLTMNNLNPATGYAFKIRGYYGSNLGLLSSPCDVYYTGTRNSACSGVKISKFSNGYVTLSWTASTEKPSGYMIYSYDSSTAKYTYLGTTSSTSYEISKLNAGKQYQFSVRAYYNSGSTQIAGVYSDLITAFTRYSRPTATATAKTSSSITLSWSSQSGCTGYQIYEKTSSGYNLVDETTKTSYTISKLKNGTSYSFTVRAYKTINNVVFGGSMSNVISTAGGYTPAQPYVKSYSASAVKLQWYAIEGAVKYQVFQLDESTGVYKLISNTTDTQYTFKNLTQCKVYKVKVRVGYSDGYSSAVYYDFTTFLPTPRNVKAAKSSSSSTISWSSVSSATGYAVYEYNRSANTYTLIGTTNKTSYAVNSTAKKSYAVRAYNKLTYKTFYSLYSVYASVS